MHPLTKPSSFLFALSFLFSPTSVSAHRNLPKNPRSHPHLDERLLPITATTTIVVQRTATQTIWVQPTKQVVVTAPGAGGDGDGNGSGSSSSGSSSSAVSASSSIIPSSSSSATSSEWDSASPTSSSSYSSEPSSSISASGAEASETYISDFPSSSSTSSLASSTIDASSSASSIYSSDFLPTSSPSRSISASATASMTESASSSESSVTDAEYSSSSSSSSSASSHHSGSVSASISLSSSISKESSSSSFSTSEITSSTTSTSHTASSTSSAETASITGAETSPITADETASLTASETVSLTASETISLTASETASLTASETASVTLNGTEAITSTESSLTASSTSFPNITSTLTSDFASSTSSNWSMSDTTSLLPSSTVSLNISATASATSTSASASASASGTPDLEAIGSTIMAAYYPDWAAYHLSPEQVDWSRFDVVDFAFALPTTDNNLVFTQDDSADLLNRLVSAGHKNGKRVKLSIGGWTGSQYFSTICGNSWSRSEFVKNILSAYNLYNLDGIDIDWEYPGTTGADGNVISSNDSANFLLFLQELRQALPTGALITTATQVWPFAGSDGRPMSDVSEFAKVIDWILIMNYDVWGSSATPGPNAPLSDGCGNSTQPLANAYAAVSSWTGAGMPANQITLGVPAYGYLQKSTASSLKQRRRSSFPTPPHKNSTRIQARASDVTVYNDWGGSSDGQIMFDALVTQGALTLTDGEYVGSGGFTRHWDSCSSTPWIKSESSGQIITYDDTQSMNLKGQFAAKVGLRGCNVFSIDGDWTGSSWPLTDAVRSGLGL